MILKSLHYVAIVVICSVTGIAQTITGGVNGTVTDPSGAVIVGAQVTATNVATNITTATKTNKDGVYSIQFLTVGQYTIKIEALGFAPDMLGPFTLEAGQVAKFDTKLGVTHATASVSVNDVLAPLMNTENAELGTTLDSSAIDNIPLDGRNFASLTIFTAGAVATSPPSFTGSAALARDVIGGSPLSVNGNRQQTNNFLLDGIEINETINNTIGYNPSPDALAQVRVVSANAQAEYGNVNGGDIIALLKTGTNRLHGSAFYYVDDYKLDANSWANNYNRIAKTSSTSNIFGANIGGPIIRDKLFFFGDYSGNRYHTGGLAVASVASALMRQGDFSELLDPALMCTPNATCKLINLYDSQNGYAPYINNRGVPITNPVAKYLYAHPELYPLPNRAPIAGSPVTSNYQGPSKSRLYNDQFDVRIDYKASDRDSYTSSYSQSTAGSGSTSPLLITFPVASTYPTKGFRINYVHTFTPTLVNEFRVGFFRTVWHQGIPNDQTGAFGMNGNAVVGIEGGNATPGFAAQTVGPLTTVGNQATYSDNAMNDFTYGNNLTWQKGKHIFKFGAQFIRYQQNSIYTGVQGAQGVLLYSGVFSSNPTASGNSGYAVADFNMDRVYSAGRGTLTGHTGQRQWRDAAFAQDDWKILPNLTFNLGVRWEYDQPIYEVNDKQSNVNLQTGALEIAGQNGNSRALYNSVWTNFMPRIGFSYNPRPRLVVRGGFGSTVYLEGTGANLRLTINPPFQTSISYTGAVPTSAANLGVFTTAESAFSANSAACAYATNPSCGQIMRAWDPALRPSTVNEFSLTTEYQLSNSASFQVGYVGETGVHLISANNGNQLTKPCFSGATLLNYNSAACFAVNKAPFYSLVGQSGFVRITQSEGMMNYNALQTTFRQRVSHGLQFTANYAYSKSMTNSTGFFGIVGIANTTSFPANPSDKSLEYGPAGTDVTHNINFNMTYELPFGRGHRFGGNVNRITDEILSGWRASVAGFAYSGFPITIITSSNNSGVNSSQQRATHYRRLIVRHHNISQWFGDDPSAKDCIVAGVDNNVCAYGTPPNGTISTAHPNSERAPGYQQYNVSVFKDFFLTETQSVTFRADAANIFNIASYGNPVASADSAQFGLITTTRSGPRTLQLSAKYKF